MRARDLILSAAIFLVVLAAGVAVYFWTRRAPAAPRHTFVVEAEGEWDGDELVLHDARVVRWGSDPTRAEEETVHPLSATLRVLEGSQVELELDAGPGAVLRHTARVASVDGGALTLSPPPDLESAALRARIVARRVLGLPSAEMCGRGVSPCIGVPGNPAGLGAAYADILRYFLGNSAGACVGRGASPGLASQLGCCRPDPEGLNAGRAAAENPLHLGATAAGEGTPITAESAAAHLFGLTKSWGTSATWKHGGVVAENVSLARTAVRTADADLGERTVLRLRITGDALPEGYAGPLGVHRGHPRMSAEERACERACDGADCFNQKCGATRFTGEEGPAELGFGYDDPRARVGACVATRALFGPGSYRVLARVPRTGWAAGGGRGYCFAVWTFAYSEYYTLSNPLAWSDVGADGKPAMPHSVLGSAADGFYTVQNHEIDIEIPGNAPQLADDWDASLGLDTMNCNTWLSDTGVYSGERPYYTQAMARAPSSFVSEAGEFHEYGFDWHVDEENPASSYVRWTFDGEEVYRTSRFVPFYAGRLLLGPWPARWGCDGRPPLFDFADVDVAGLSVAPEAGGAAASIPQMYDQRVEGRDIACGFTPLHLSDPYA